MAGKLNSLVGAPLNNITVQPRGIAVKPREFANVEIEGEENTERREGHTWYHRAMPGNTVSTVCFGGMQLRCGGSTAPIGQRQHLRDSENPSTPQRRPGCGSTRTPTLFSIEPGVFA